MTTVYAVVYNGYYPLRVDSLWMKRSEAEDEAKKKGDRWEVCLMGVQGEVEGRKVEGTEISKSS